MLCGRGQEEVGSFLSKDIDRGGLEAGGQKTRRHLCVKERGSEEARMEVVVLSFNCVLNGFCVFTRRVD